MDDIAKRLRRIWSYQKQL